MFRIGTEHARPIDVLYLPAKRVTYRVTVPPVMAGLDPAIYPRNDVAPRCDPIDPGKMAGSMPGHDGGVSGHDDEFVAPADPG